MSRIMIQLYLDVLSSFHNFSLHEYRTFRNHSSSYLTLVSERLGGLKMRLRVSRLCS